MTEPLWLEALQCGIKKPMYTICICILVSSSCLNNLGRFVQKTNQTIELVFFDCNVRINIMDAIEEKQVMVELIMRTDERHFHL